MPIANTTTNTTLKNVRIKLNEMIGVVNTLGTGNVSNTYLQSTFATKAYAASNTAIRTIVSDRIQVANANAKYATKGYAASNSYVNLLLANTNAYIASIGSGGGGGTAAVDYGSISSAIDVALNQDFGTL